MNCIKHGKYTGDSCFGCSVKIEECEIRDRLYRKRWIPCSERLPERDYPVLVTAINKMTAVIEIINACYVAPHTYTTEEYGWREYEGDKEYDKENDCFWIPECWYEDNAIEDNGNWILDDEYQITAWMLLPESYKEDSK